MTFGTGPQALTDLLTTAWEPTRAGRPDVPDVTEDQHADPGSVFVTHDRDEVNYNQNVHDMIHCYHPEAAGIAVEDRGYQEQNVVETVQIDIDTADRTDPGTGERLGARERMVGDRDNWGGGVPFTVSQTVGDAQYPGIFGEVKYILEEKRRGLEEWDVARHDVVQMQLLNSNARISLNVELEHIAINTADA